MIKIRIVCEYPHGACSYYRTYGVLTKLHKLNPQIQVAPVNEIDWCTLADTDILFMERPYSGIHLQVVDLAKAYGIKVWVDHDDNLLSVPEDGNQTKKTFEANYSNITKILELADVVTVTTETLWQKYKRYNHKTKVIPNAFNDYNYHFDFAFSGKKAVAWRGSETHVVDIMTVKNEIIKTANKYPDWLWNFFGQDMYHVTAEMPNAKQTEKLPLVKYFQTIREFNHSIQIIPLVDNEFNRAKSNCGWIEAIYCGAVTVAPELPEFKRAGVVNYRTPAEFSDAMERLINDRQFHKECYDQGYEYIKENLLLSNVNQKRYDVVKGLLA